jgi:hypothetical protein
MLKFNWFNFKFQFKLLPDDIPSTIFGKINYNLLNFRLFILNNIGQYFRKNIIIRFLQRPRIFQMFWANTFGNWKYFIYNLRVRYFNIKLDAIYWKFKYVIWKKIKLGIVRYNIFKIKYKKKTITDKQYFYIFYFSHWLTIKNYFLFYISFYVKIVKKLIFFSIFFSLKFIIYKFIKFIINFNFINNKFVYIFIYYCYNLLIILKNIINIFKYKFIIYLYLKFKINKIIFITMYIHFYIYKFIASFFYTDLYYVNSELYDHFPSYQSNIEINLLNLLTPLIPLNYKKKNNIFFFIKFFSSLKFFFLYWFKNIIYLFFLFYFCDLYLFIIIIKFIYILYYFIYLKKLIILNLNNKFLINKYLLFKFKIIFKDLEKNKKFINKFFIFYFSLFLGFLFIVFFFFYLNYIYDFSNINLYFFYFIFLYTFYYNLLKIKNFNKLFSKFLINFGFFCCFFFDIFIYCFKKIIYILYVFFFSIIFYPSFLFLLLFIFYNNYIFIYWLFCNFFEEITNIFSNFFCYFLNFFKKDITLLYFDKTEYEYLKVKYNYFQFYQRSVSWLWPRVNGFRTGSFIHLYMDRFIKKSAFGIKLARFSSIFTIYDFSHNETVFKNLKLFKFQSMRKPYFFDSFNPHLQHWDSYLIDSDSFYSRKDFMYFQEQPCNIHWVHWSLSPIILKHYGYYPWPHYARLYQISLVRSNQCVQYFNFFNYFVNDINSTMPLKFKYYLLWNFKLNENLMNEQFKFYFYKPIKIFTDKCTIIFKEVYKVYKFYENIYMQLTEKKNYSIWINKTINYIVDFYQHSYNSFFFF